MRLRLKFNIVLAGVFLVGLGAAALVSYPLLQHHARQEALRQARLMLETASAIRAYTAEQVAPHLATPRADAFLPQAVPAFAATEIINHLRQRPGAYHYKEAALNPTNPRNRATGWEADAVDAFRRQPQLQEIVAERHDDTGRRLWIAKPIAVTQAACLQCHGAPSAAPAGLLRQYGPSHGFGWQPGEVVGAQIVQVAMDVPLSQASQLLTTAMVSLTAVGLFVFIALNLMMGWLILRPIRRMAQAADRLSTGDFTQPEFSERGRDEIAILGSAFNRLRRSLHKAMALIGAPCAR